MKKRLVISNVLALPPDTVTSTLIVYGGKGMGKTVFGAVVAEELDKVSYRWSWLDPLGVSWGITHSADGKGPGVKCLILGGIHGDIPIYPDSGLAVADTVVEESCNVLVDFSRTSTGKMWSVGERIRFATAYARRLFERQGEIIRGRRREPLMQFLDEGARYIPQIVPAGSPDLALCVSAWQQLVEEGRNVGVGVCVLTQRSARINKDVAELADAMVAFRTVGPKSRAAVMDWLGDHVEKERLKDLSDQVRKLPKGSALIVSPGWLEFEGVVPIRMRRTFDSSDTPKPGKKMRTARGPGAKPNLEKIRARMAETIERAKAEDPKEIKKLLSDRDKRIVELEKKLGIAMLDADRKGRAVAAAVVPKKAVVPVNWKRMQRRMASELKRGFDEIERLASNVLVDEEVLHGQDLRAAQAEKTPPPAPSPAPPKRAFKPNGASNGASRDPSIGESGLCRMMIALAQSSEGLSRRTLAIRAGLSPRTGTFITYLSRGRTAGWIEGGERGATAMIRITDAGVTALGHYEPLPAGDALFNYWLHEVGRDSGAGRMMVALKEAFPNALSRVELAERSNLSAKTGTFITYLSRLRGLDLIDGEGRSEMRLAQDLVG